MKYALVLLAFCGFNTFAESLTVEYGTFYSHLRKIDDEDLNQLEFAFGFKQVGTSGLCQINSATIHTQKVDIPLEVTADRRFTLPTEKALKLANAQVEIDLVQPANQCDMSVQIQIKPELIKQTMTIAELSAFLHQFDIFFDDMGSFLSFLMPSADGILLEFAQNDIDITLDNQPVSGLPMEKQQLILKREWLDGKQGEIAFSPVPEKITVFVSQD
ncbi:DUF2987 domain-containing protein [Neptunicella sp. SCSIO 80796]|uniref:DUF2987 domain-containing protein n=1 Tax=Neptunicella plasticusilytica TaxID=3117012 RepID=UPI003A4E4CF7